jgi:uncharacterized protein YciI
MSIIQKSTVYFLWAMTILLSACEGIDDSKAEVLAAQQDTLETAAKPKVEVFYDSTKAVKYGADDYGMKTYVMALLKSGPNRLQDSAKSAELMRAHLDNIKRLAEEGKLILAGPFYEDQDLRGIYILDTDNIDSAKAMTESDPAIQYGSLEMELLKWYGSAALMEVNEIHTQISKEEI